MITGVGRSNQRSSEGVRVGGNLSSFFCADGRVIGLLLN